MEREIITREQALDRGLARYFTGTQCKNGHVDERWTRSYSCISCIRLAKRASRKRVADRLAAARAETPA